MFDRTFFRKYGDSRVFRITPGMAKAKDFPFKEEDYLMMETIDEKVLDKIKSGDLKLSGNAILIRRP